jgi:hypothetical protein
MPLLGGTALFGMSQVLLWAQEGYHEMAEGRVAHNLQDPSASYAQITSVQEHEGMLCLGSLVEDAIGRLPVP